MRLEFRSFELPCTDTCTSFLEVKRSSDFQPAGYRFCCTKPSGALVSEMAEMLLILSTDTASTSRFSGFSVRYKTGENISKAIDHSANVSAQDVSIQFRPMYTYVKNQKYVHN